MRLKPVFGLIIIAMAAACSDSAGGSIVSGLNFWRITKDAEKSYPNKTPLEARKQYARDKFAAASSELNDPQQRRVLAASFYLGYSMLNGRAIPEYCGEMRVEVDQFRTGFIRANRSLEAALDSILAEENLTREDVWQRQKRFAMAAAKNELLTAGALKGSYEVCKSLKEHPYEFLPRANFARDFPQIAAAMTIMP